MTPVAKAVGANRVVKAHAIINPTGDPELPPAEEKELRRQLIMEALKALQTEELCPINWKPGDKTLKKP